MLLHAVRGRTQNSEGSTPEPADGRRVIEIPPYPSFTPPFFSANESSRGIVRESESLATGCYASYPWLSFPGLVGAVRCDEYPAEPEAVVVLDAAAHLGVSPTGTALAR